jgi:hypothetical protein
MGYGATSVLAFKTLHAGEAPGFGESLRES